VLKLAAFANFLIECCSNSSDDIEDDPYMEDRRKVPPVSANNHLYCHASTLDLPLDALYHNMDHKTQK